jgi:hypothetical protein
MDRYVDSSTAGPLRHKPASDIREKRAARSMANPVGQMLIAHHASPQRSLSSEFPANWDRSVSFILC